MLLAGNPVIGMNLNGASYWNPEWIFKDAFLQNSGWAVFAYDTHPWEPLPDAGTLSLDAQGWPTELKQWVDDKGLTARQYVSTLLFRAMGDHYPTGLYRAEWEGKGTVTFEYAAKQISQGTTSDGKNYAILDVHPSVDGIRVNIMAMDPADPVRNIHVWMPDYSGQSLAGPAWRPGMSGVSPFHPLFMERLAPFGAIRFMDWGNTNGTTIEHWSDRTPADYAVQTSDKGVAYEYMIELANELHADPWLNIPSHADDDYIRNFATLVRDSLAPDRKVYLEWSNEVWNWYFPTFQWLQSQLQLPENAGQSVYTLWAARMKNAFDIWSDVFQGQEDRLVRVVASQAAGPWILDTLLSHLDGHYDAVAVGDYTYAPDSSIFNASSTGDQVAQAALDYVPTVTQWLKNNKARADKYGAQLGRNIPLLVYEGGQHLVGNRQPYQQAYIDAQSSPIMYKAYAQLLQGAKDAGVDLFMHYSSVSQPARYGSWGALQYQDQPTADAPKYQALLDAVSGEIYDMHPQASLGGPYAVSEGGTLQLSAAASTGRYIQKYEWDLDGDGVFGETGPSAARGDEVGMTPLFDAAGLDGPGRFAIALRVTDILGKTSKVSGAIQIDDAPPSLRIDGLPAARAGEAYTLTLQASESGTDSITCWRIDWGDGSVQLVDAKQPTASHAYASAGTYTVRAWAYEGVRAFAAESGTVSVAGLAATFSSRPTIQFGAVYIDVNINWQNGADRAMISNSRIVVSGPRSFRQVAKLLKTADTTGIALGAKPACVATYRIAAPRGGWGPKDNGTYTVFLAGGSGTAAVLPRLGDFQINLAPAGPNRRKAASIGRVTFGQSFISTFADGSDAHEVFYAFVLDKAAAVNLNVADSGADVDLDLLDRKGRLIGASRHPGKARESLRLSLKPGTFYVRVHTTGKKPGYVMNLSVSAPRSVKKSR